ncbi:MAG: hypothetical protein HYX76_10950 [Acidobacteria bacterium]|nr:hypothetical protein [Acidobacteriota bacterium]
MKLYYYRDRAGNFGDDLNCWLWPRLMPELLDDDPRVLLLGIGTILNSTIPRRPLKVVFGSGAGYGRAPALDERWKIYCVRGPLTCAALGLPGEAAITDAAMLVRLIVEPSAATGKPAFMPHHVSAIRAELDGLELAGICRAVGLEYLDPMGDPSVTLERLRKCPCLITEAMHGAIVADALRIPWIPVRIYSQVNESKWLDWCRTLDLSYEPFSVADRTRPPDSRTLVDFLADARRARAVLSADRVLSGVLERLVLRLEDLKADAAAGKLVRNLEGDVESARNEMPFDSRRWWKDVYVFADLVREILPPGQRCLLVDDSALGLNSDLDGRILIPFLEREGQPWGAPPDSTAAIEELERERVAGAAFIAFAWPAFWWLEYYQEFATYLGSRFPRLAATGHAIVFDLRRHA